MKLGDERESSNVEDQRGMRPGLAVGGGIGTVVILLIAMVMGADPRKLLSLLNQQQGAQQTQGPVQSTPEEQERLHFVKQVLATTEDVWTVVFKQNNLRAYEQPKLEVFRDQVQTGCGGATSSAGPFYCPADQKVYIDLAFYVELKDQLHSPGDGAEAYVIAHEIGHHIQKLRGITDDASLHNQFNDNEFSVRLELQADFYAGVWANHTKQYFENGDLDSIVNAAFNIGDDTLTKRAGKDPDPSNFTHGSSKQRMAWFKHGWDTGDINQGNTFNSHIDIMHGSTATE